MNEPKNTQELVHILNAQGITSVSALVYSGIVAENSMAIVQSDALLTDSEISGYVAHLLHILFEYWIDDVQYGVILINVDDDAIHISANLELNTKKYATLGYLSGGPYVTSSALSIHHLETRKAVQVLLYNPYPKLFRNIVLDVVENPLTLTLSIN